MEEVRDEKKDYDGDEVVVVNSVKSTPHTSHHISKFEKDLDSAAAIATGIVPTPEEAKMILRKIDWNLLPLMMALYLMQFLDKTTLGNSGKV